MNSVPLSATSQFASGVSMDCAFKTNLPFTFPLTRIQIKTLIESLQLFIVICFDNALLAENSGASVKFSLS